MRSESPPEQHAQHTYRSTGHERCRPAPFLADDEADEDDEEEMLFPARTPRSAIRYQTSAQHQPTRQVTAQAPRAVTVYRTHRRTQSAEHPLSYAASPPQRLPRRHHRVHWLVYVGLSLCIMLLGWVSLSVFCQWWQVTQDDWHYGRPRTFQVDVVVGHGDSPASPSHFLALNLSRHIEIIEFPGGDATHAKVYQGPTLIGEGEDLAVVTLRFKDVNDANGRECSLVAPLAVVTLRFKDVNGDGKPDMLVSVQDSTIIYLNENGQFRPLKAGEHDTV